MTDNQNGGSGEGRSPLRFSVIGAPLPPIDWTLATLTGQWLASGEMISCPLPGHDDSTPSFNLWAEDDQGVPQRYGCFGCGKGGDVVSLIAELEGLSEQQALERAAKLGEEEQGADYKRERTPKPRKQPARPHAETYDMIVSSMGIPEFGTLHKFMEEKGMGGEALGNYAMEEWGWAAIGFEVVHPHKALGNEVTGIKYRDPRKPKKKQRRNEDGSHFPALYGAWRDRNKKNVLICEGETDTVWAAWSLRDWEDWDVMGLPSGVGQRVNPEWLDLLEGREVTIAFDADKEGMTGAKIWCDERPGTLVARLPEGEDVRSCGIPVKEIVERAGVPMVHTGQVNIVNGIFVKQSQQGAVPLGDFSFEPVLELDTDEGPAWEGTISGRRDQSLLRASDLTTAVAMTKWANKHGRSWTGSGSAGVQGVFNLLTSMSAFMPLEKATTKAGKVGRSFVGPDFCIGLDRARYIPPAFGDAKLETRIHIEKGEWDPMAIRGLELMNDPGTMAIILGWLCATLLRGERAPAPPLFVSGESGAGKTNLLSTVLGAVGFGAEVNLTTTTPFGVDCMVSSCIGFPVWFDEYRSGARSDSMERLRQLLRDAYYGQPSMKGGMKTQATELSEVSTWAGIVVSGEMGSGETSHRDRIVMIDLDPEKRNKKAFKWMQEKGRTAGMGYALLDFLARRSDALFSIEPQGDTELPDRFRDTLGFVKTGWDAWLEFRWAAGLRDTPVGPDLDSLGATRHEAEDPWLEAIKACEGMTTRDNTPIVEKQEGGVTVIPSEVIIEAQRIGIELPARANEMVQWLKRRYTVQDVRVGMSRRRGKYVEGMKLDD